MAPELNGHGHSDIMPFGTFFLDSQLFGADLLRMREIIRPLNITKVPRAENFMAGVINLRGMVIPVISLRDRFGMPSKPIDKTTRIIHMEIDNTVVGFLVDAIGQVYHLSPEAIEPPPIVVASTDMEYIAGIARLDEQLLIILNMDKLVSLELLKDFPQE